MAKRKPHPTPDPIHRPPAEEPKAAEPTPSDPSAGPDHPFDRVEQTAGGDPGGHAAAVRPDGPRVPNPFGHKQDAAAGVRLLEDRRFKQAQLKFEIKPSDAVREVVREAGFRWLREEGVWAKQIDPDKGWQTRADADALFDRVAALIRAEKGVTHEVV